MEDTSGYLFPEEDRTGIFSTPLLFAIAFFTLGIWRVLDPSFLDGVLMEVFGLLLAVLLYIVFSHFKHRKLLLAKYTISSETIILKLGDDEIRFSNRKPFRVSIVPLFRSSGKSYAYIPYIAIWDKNAPCSNVHPYKILKSKDILLLPYTDEIYKKVILWANISVVPAYPLSEANE